MKFNTLKRHIREGFKNVIRNGWMSVASIGAVTVTLVLVGTFITLMLNINQMTVNVEEDVKIKTLIDVTADDDAIKKLGEEIEAISGVATVEFSSKDDEFRALIEDMGEQGKAWELYEQDNPLNHAYIVQTIEPQETE
ncbi:MAG: permease-like cell division protein FtsX, partial [Bacillales bacterium]